MDLFSTDVLDIVIQDARNKKKTLDSKMDLFVSLIREVEWREKAAEKAKQEVDNRTLDIYLEMDELTTAQQHVKESNEKRAKEVYAQRAELATKMKVLQFCISDVLNEGDGCVAAIDEMCKSLEKRLTLAVLKKESADKDKLGKERALAYQKIQMQKLLEESKKLEQEAMENLKLQEFLIDRARVLNMLREEISCKCHDVNLLEVEFDDYQDEHEISVAKDYLKPIIQETTPMQDCECYKCYNVLKGVDGRTSVSSREETGTNTIVKSWINDSELIQELADSYMDQLDKGVRIGPNLKHVHQESQMEKLVEESTILEQQEMENLKEFLLIKEMPEESQDESEILVTEDYLSPIMQETITTMKDCECYKCCNILEGVDERVVASWEETRTNKIIKSEINDLKMVQELADSYTNHQQDKFKRARKPDGKIGTKWRI